METRLCHPASQVSSDSSEPATSFEGPSVTEYGVVEGHHEGGSLLRGIVLENLPPMLEAKVTKRITLLTSTDMADERKVAETIKDCLMDFFGELKLLAKTWPVSLESKF